MDIPVTITKFLHNIFQIFFNIPFHLNFSTLNDMTTRSVPGNLKEKSNYSFCRSI